MFSRWRFLLTTLLFGVALSGCGRVTFNVMRYPDFWSSTEGEIKTIAIAPFGNSSSSEGAQYLISKDILHTLIKYDTYSVVDATNEDYHITQQEIADMAYQQNVNAESLTEDLVAQGYTVVDEETAAAEREAKYKGANAILYGNVLEDWADTRTELIEENEQVPVYARDRYGRILVDEEGNDIIDHWERVRHPWTTNTGFSKVEIQLVSVSNNITLLSVPVTGRYESEGYPPSFHPMNCLQGARTQVVNKVVEMLIPHTERVTMASDEMLYIGRMNAQGGIDKTDKFSPSDENVSVGITLPSEARLNNFRVVVVEEDKENVLVDSQDLVWTNSGVILSFPVAQIMEGSGSAPKYEMRILVQDKFVTKKKFSIQ